jgi:CubicO group peptidase (beta-lactamase class C family)
MRPLLPLVFAVQCSLFTLAAAQPAPLRPLDGYVTRALPAWEAPGLAIAVVKDGALVYARGWGVRELGKPDLVDGNTLFAVGSTSKAFTSALLGILVDEGKVGWDDPVTKHLPGFQLYDPYVTREITIRDLLTHRSGLSRGDRLWAASGLGRDEILRRERFLKPSWSFRSQYGYQNVMFLAAGELAGRVLGMSWDDAVHQRIFEPLGMVRTRTSVAPLAGMDNVASPHERIDDKVTPVPWMNIDNIGPAGSINSSVSEMAQWVRLQLGQGNYGGKQLIAPKTVREMHTLQMHQRPSETDDSLFATESHLMGYGLAWALRDYRGYKLVSHGGAIRGMRAQVAMIPEKQLGVVVLTNVSESSLPTAMAYKVLDLMLGAPAKDWSALYLAETKKARARAADERQKAVAARVPNTAPSLALDKYAGTYADSLYGPITVTQENGTLVARFGPHYTGDLTHWHFNTFEVVWRDKFLGRTAWTFTLNPGGQVSGLEVPSLPATFGRVPGSGAAR